VTTYYGVSAPLGSGKTTAAIEVAGHAARAGQKYVIAQPSIELINQSARQFRERWPNIAVKAIHGESANNVAREIADHTRKSSNGEVLFITHAALMQCPYWDRRKDWNLIVDEAPQIFYSAEFTLPVNYQVLLPALEVHHHNIRYSRLLPGDIDVSEP
jgi:superfamily II DNA or RNA helicase